MTDTADDIQIYEICTEYGEPIGDSRTGWQLASVDVPVDVDIAPVANGTAAENRRRFRIESVTLTRTTEIT